jgi:hypothetical protein
MRIDWCGSMETAVGYLRNAEAERASGVSLFDKDQMLGAAEKKLKDRTVSGEEGVVCWSVSLSESHFMMFCSMLLFDIDLLMRAGPGHPGWEEHDESRSEHGVGLAEG